MAYPPSQPAGRGVLSDLIEKASEQGYLTLEDILEANSQREDEVASRPEKLLDYLSRQGVDIVGFSEGETHQAGAAGDSTIAFSFAPNFDAVQVEDSIEIYLKEMARVPLLSVDEEVSLAQRIDQGRKAKGELSLLKSIGSCSKRRALEESIKDGTLAREHIIEANTRLVVSIAKRYIGRGVPFLDLIQEGNLGLMKAVEKYDYRRGFRFSTYATWWIRQTITRAIADQGRTIRLPVHMSDRIRQLYRALHDLEQSLGRPPTAEELAVRLQITARKVQWMLQVSWVPLSLESPVGEEEDAELGMFVEDQTTPTPAQVVYQNMLRERVEEVLASLTPREARVLRLRFGLDEDRPYTLEEVGAKFGLTRERIRQIEGKALRRLRHPGCARRLRDYL